MEEVYIVLVRLGYNGRYRVHSGEVLLEEAEEIAQREACDSHNQVCIVQKKKQFICGELREVETK